ncbi:hypothetical protein J2W36_004662 [Variovorax ginsengisoli]|uniref:Uncharacterized protein n=1 Tax=Variovorax ginsengisoli TaxID=363844 RepID=A0ABT9SDF1_9BURK|nr:hypothetical protein [Variovorax ginsengisoli]
MLTIPWVGCWANIEQGTPYRACRAATQAGNTGRLGR